MTDFTELVDLASERLGGEVLWATDEFFGPKENLLKAAAPVFIPDKYTDAGKWMDGWETRRHRAPDHDWCQIRLGAPGIVRGIVVDTAHFTGNFPEKCSLEASADQQEWTELLAPSGLRGAAQNCFAIHDPFRYTHLRFHIYPDGGVARLRVHGELIPERLDDFINLAAMENGGRVIEASDMFFGSRHNLICPGRSTGMHDGWETRRRRGPGHDWAILELAAHGEIRRVEVDTFHFKGNFPESCSLETEAGQEILPRTRLQAHTGHVFESELKPASASRVRFCIYPDGGVSRLRIFGIPTELGRAAHAVRLWNSLTPAEARNRFLGCCGSRSWANAMTAARPFASMEAIFEAGVRIWRGLAREDWLEAFAAHSRIGERTSDELAASEQSGTNSASSAVLGELARLNRDSEAKFGYIYIVCATGKSADQMLALLRSRLANDPQEELGIAAEEQLRITQLRLQKTGSSR
ncbi:MAG: bifunctional allantoicase/OHCU decarboxylase [Acidobacteria bacterium]|nr:MAG: bifunctional allantoicase/OHCU decarboxylase [Acidobacteriota bacterium]